MDNLCVVMLGPSLRQQGGMATVENLIVNHPAAQLQIRHIALHEEGTIYRRLVVFWRGLWQFLLALIGQPVNVVHVHVSERGSVLRAIVLVWLAQLFRKPVIMHTHGCEFHVFFEALPRLIRWFVALTLRRCAVLIALSDSWRQYYIERCRLDPNRVVVLLNPVKVPSVLPRRPQAAKLQLIFLGRVGHRKGAFDVIKAVAQLPIALQQRLQLRLAGDGEVAQAADLIEQYQLQHCIELLGWIDADMRDQLLSQSDIFLLPSHNEGLPVAMLEAMAWGLPVIVTPVGGIPEMVTQQQQGFLVEPGDVDAIAAALHTLLTDEAQRLQMGQAARAKVEPLDVKQYHRVLQELYGMARSLTPGQIQRQPIMEMLDFSHEKAS
ncbi:glycosyltransferase family 4 protein [filamentous cyanobacterium LEGE 11480]|uniref:Glycosyltransferase family 4 protein n=1 Tax=Romeriopsis navalis LEGE 11480 TaxID=2777977 RepID=A0A928Z3W3_9CYAN|nr:glycosyltransferase family 4 protein [Romeriopsis navalis]MBE9030422.1 glycosyltransferase family 4 protein [Romeriopsis navalis LEGE 11480]